MASTPVITALRAIPVAGRDSMLLNLSGAHGPFFSRNLVIVTDSAGRTGVDRLAHRISDQIADRRFTAADSGAPAVQRRRRGADRRIDQAAAAARNLLQRAGLAWDHIGEAPPSLEDVFVSLVRAEGGAVLG